MALQEFAELLQNRDNLQVYNAGLPRFPRNFTRDSIISALLANSPEMMREQLKFCALHQGTSADPRSGEEPGKIHHEWPGYPIRDKLTTYNGCDTTAFFLIGFGWLHQLDPNQTPLDGYEKNIQAAADYIESHLNQHRLFEESPNYCGADSFALKVTYWKDSVILDRLDGEPDYPAVYSLAHIQNLAGMRAAATLLESPHFHEIANQMANAISHLWDDQTGTLLAAIDQLGPIRAISSDALHALFYLEKEDLTAEQIDSIVLASEMLESQIGYLLMTPEDGSRMDRAYHADTVWPFEQALIHAGAEKFGLNRVMRICKRVLRVLPEGESPELFSLKVLEPAIASNPQLWTLAAKKYFDS